MTDPDRSDTPAHGNRLADETSAYLRQHMHNPVDWYPWGEEAFARAKREDKPLLVSIGYSACHWCHVMAHESFEHAETAALMNELFVNVKVDREERPDVDQIYMDTVVRLTGHGGWPLTVFCTPDGRPFYAGTYYPREPRGPGPTFRQLLQAVNDAWQKRRDEVEESAAQIVEALVTRPAGSAERTPGVASLVDGAGQLMQNADMKHGGFGGGPKFPTPTNLELLLAASLHMPEESAAPLVDHCVFTGREMARRGLYDHLGGGFHRYCVDGSWTIPHFEKMLYDNGLLLRVYAELHRRTGDAEFAWPIEETVAWLRREMRGPEGAFYASQDADSEGEEGRYYVWTPLEVGAVLGDAAPAFLEAYGIDERGNFEGGTTHLVDRARRPRWELAREREKLRAHRSQRVPPGTDSKRVTAWNGYAISGLARAASELGDASMLADATRAADFLLENMRDEKGRLRRVFADEPRGPGQATAKGRVHVLAFLDDHAALLDACLDLHRAGAGQRYLEAARRLADDIARRFYDADERDLFLTPRDGEALVHRPRSDNDGATPHAAGQALLGLVRVAELSGDRALADVARAVLATHAFVIERAPHAFPTLLRAAALFDHGPSVAVIVGDPDDGATRVLAAAARRALAPEDAVLVVAPGAGAPEGVDASWLAGREALAGRPTAWVCRGTSCSLPITRPEGFQPA